MALDTKSDRKQRIAHAKKIRIYWQDESGTDNFAYVHSLDVSESGLRLELQRRISPRSVILMQSDDARLNGSASVRYCDSFGGRLVAGVEFLGGLRLASPKQLAGRS